jgi:hypothetical protein
MESIKMNWPLVDPEDDGIIPEGSPTACYYCGQEVGTPHLRDCVIVEKRVRIRYIVSAEIEIPYHWSEERITASWLEDIGQFMERKYVEGGGVMFKILSIDDTPIRHLKSDPDLP